MTDIHDVHAYVTQAHKDNTEHLARLRQSLNPRTPTDILTNLINNTPKAGTHGQ